MEFGFWNLEFSSRGGHNIISDNERWYNELMATQRKIKVTSLDEIRGIIKQHEPELRGEFHVDRIGVFGSYARGAQKKRSDIDFLVTFDEAISLFTLSGLRIYLQEQLGRKVDVVPYNSLRPELRKYVFNDLITDLTP